MGVGQLTGDKEKRKSFARISVRIFSAILLTFTVAVGGLLTGTQQQAAVFTAAKNRTAFRVILDAGHVELTNTINEVGILS